MNLWKEEEGGGEPRREEEGVQERERDKDVLSCGLRALKRMTRPVVLYHLQHSQLPPTSYCTTRYQLFRASCQIDLSLSRLKPARLLHYSIPSS